MTRWDERDLAFYEAHAQYIATGRRQRVSMARNGQWLVRSVGSKSVVPVDERRWTFHTFMGE